MGPAKNLYRICTIFICVLRLFDSLISSFIAYLQFYSKVQTSPILHFSFLFQQNLNWDLIYFSQNPVNYDLIHVVFFFLFAKTPKGPFILVVELLILDKIQVFVKANQIQQWRKESNLFFHGFRVLQFT